MKNENENVKWWILATVSLFVGMLPIYIHNTWAFIFLPIIGSIGIIESLYRLK